MRIQRPPPYHRSGSARHQATQHHHHPAAAGGSRIEERGTCNPGNTRAAPSPASATRGRRRAWEPCRIRPDRRVNCSWCTCPHRISPPASPVALFLRQRRRTWLWLRFCFWWFCFVVCSVRVLWSVPAISTTSACGLYITMGWAYCSFFFSFSGLVALCYGFLRYLWFINGFGRR